MFELETIIEIEEYIKKVGKIDDDGKEYNRYNAFDDIEFSIELYYSKEKYLQEFLDNLPDRFVDEFLETIEYDSQTLNSLRKNIEFFLDEINNELTEEEIKYIYG